MPKNVFSVVHKRFSADYNKKIKMLLLKTSILKKKLIYWLIMAMTFSNFNE